jgi:hypothetical protein
MRGHMERRYILHEHGVQELLEAFDGVRGTGISNLALPALKGSIHNLIETSHKASLLRPSAHPTQTSRQQSASKTP